ncbi:MAG: hypothetical protein J7513_11655 [Solirubrobacteraceae bacterium]|nr:hypothetical protein [Solirubrobacteraceae bacterium]
MNVNATNSALIGVYAAQGQMDAAAQAAARSGLIGDGGNSVNAATGDIVDAVVGGANASTAQAVNLAMLRRAMDMQKSIIDVIA